LLLILAALPLQAWYFGTIIRGDYDRLFFVVVVWRRFSCNSSRFWYYLFNYRRRKMNLIILLSIPVVIMPFVVIYALVSEYKIKKSNKTEAVA